MPRRFIVAALFVAIGFVGCDKRLVPTAPTSNTPRSETSSLSANTVVITVTKTNATRMEVTLAENINLALDRPIQDLNGALHALTSFSCPSTNNKGRDYMVEYPNGRNAATGKNEIHFANVTICGGVVDFALRAHPWNPAPNPFNDWRQFVFLNRSAVRLNSGFTLRKESDELWHIKG